MGAAPSLADVVASDRRYFELGAVATELPGAVLLHLPGSSGVGAGTVVWVDDPSVVAGTPGWAEGAASAAAGCGAPVLRVYGLGPDGRAAEACAAGGLTARQELAYVGDRSAFDQRIELRPAVGDDGLAARRAVAGSVDAAPDGHPVDAEAYLAGEERRAGSGELELFVAWDDGEPVALAGAMRHGGLLRLKNLVVRPDRRCRGVASRVVSVLADQAEREGRWLAAVALAGDHGERIYRGLGMTVAGTYTEWSKPLDGPDGGEREHGTRVAAMP